MLDAGSTADGLSVSAGSLDGLMLAEHAHRMANDMAVVIAELEACRIRLRGSEASSTLVAIIDHVRHVCRVQRCLMCPEEGEVGLHTVLKELAENIQRARAGRNSVSLVLDLAELRVDSRFAWKLATIVAEALTNAFKYGLARRGGQVRLSLEAREHWIFCTVADDGAELNIPTVQGSGQGYRIIEAVSADLGGAAAYLRSAAGMQFRVALPNPRARGLCHGKPAARTTVLCPA